jgi:small-conductance mechanosensitive channel
MTTGIESTSPAASASRTPRTAVHGPHVAKGKLGFGSAGFAATVASMSPAVSQVSRSTKTRLRFLRRLILLVVFLVVLAIALSQFTELKRLATGILASTAVLAAIIGFAAQHTIGNMVAGVQLAVSQPIKIGDRISFGEVSGRVVDITLSYTYVNPGDGTSIVIPNQLLVEGVVHNLSTEDTQA